MQADKKELFLKQIEKSNSVFDVLQNQLDMLGIEDGVNFLSIARDNLQNLAEE